MTIGSPHRRGRLAVVFLARAAEGLDALRRFQASYAAHNAGVEHDLVVVFKGFSKREELVAARAVFAEHSFAELEIDDSGFDVNAYYKAAQSFDYDYLCCLNTHSEIMADGWLEALHRHGTCPDVGIASATGSYESFLSSLLFVHEVRSRWYSHRVYDEERYLHFFNYLFNSAEHPLPWHSVWRARLCSLPIFDRLFRRYLQKRFGGSGPNGRAVYPPFPNPHVRSNAFLMRRDRLLLQSSAVSVRTKWDAYAFESGGEGLTANILRAGLQAIVVGRDGCRYDIEQWPKSDTFRTGEQANLLVSDNQTRRFARLTSGQRTTVERMTWGDFASPAPPEFLEFQCVFESTAGLPTTPCA